MGEVCLPPLSILYSNWSHMHVTCGSRVMLHLNSPFGKEEERSQQQRNLVRLLNCITLCLIAAAEYCLPQQILEDVMTNSVEISPAKCRVLVGNPALLLGSLLRRPRHASSILILGRAIPAFCLGDLLLKRVKVI